MNNLKSLVSNVDLNDKKYRVVIDPRSYGGKNNYAGILKQLRSLEDNKPPFNASFLAANAAYNGYHVSEYDKTSVNSASSRLSWPMDSKEGQHVFDFFERVVRFYTEDPRAEELARLKSLKKNPVANPVKRNEAENTYDLWVKVSPDSFLNKKTGKMIPGTTVHCQPSTGKVIQKKISEFEKYSFAAKFVEFGLELKGSTKNNICVKLYNLYTGTKVKEIEDKRKNEIYSLMTPEEDEDDTYIDIANMPTTQPKSTKSSDEMASLAGESPQLSAESLANVKGNDSDSESSEEEEPPQITPTKLATKGSR